MPMNELLTYIVQNLVDHPELIGKRVYVKGNVVASYFGTTGLKGTSEYRIP